jgi:hypothetical protein
VEGPAVFIDPWGKGDKMSEETAVRPAPTGMTKKTPETIEAVLKAVEAGGTLTDAARVAGIGRRTLYDWLEQDTELVERIDEAKLRRREKLLKRIEQSSEEGDWKAAAWILERTMPEEFSRNAKVTIGGQLATNSVTVNKVEIDAGDPERIARILGTLAIAGAIGIAGEAGGAGEGDDAEADEVHSAGA